MTDNARIAPQLTPAQGGDPSAGDLLRQGREARGLSVNEVAESLHIIPRYVRCLESGDYQALPGRVFIRGYTRSYARLLGLSEEAMLARLELPVPAQNLEPLQPQDSPGPGLPTAGRKNFLLLGLLGLLVIVLLYAALTVLPGLFAGLANLLDDFSSEPASSTLTLPEPEASMPGSITLPAEPQLEDLPQPAASSTLPEAAEAQAPVTDPAPAPIAEPELPRVSAPAAEAPQDPEPVAVQTRPGPVDVPEPASVATEAEPTPAGTFSELQVSFQGDCWFDVRDALNGREVGLFRSGDTLTFRGQPPFQVIAGAVDVVSLELDGEPIDLDAYPVWNNRVEVTLGVGQ